MLGDGAGKEVWLIKSRSDLVSDVTGVALQFGTKYAPFVASRDFNWHLIRHEGKGISLGSCCLRSLASQNPRLTTSE
jgi:hypothetical protein